MWKLTATTALLCSAAWGSFSYQRTLTIDHTKVPNTDQVDFPVLVSISDATLKLAGNGGHVQNTNGYDICFYADAGHTQVLSWEIEKYDGSAGSLLAWVRIPLLSHTSDTVIYVFYGDPAISTGQSAASGVWDTNFAGVWHFSSAGSPDVHDSTANSANGTNNSTTSAPGQIDGAASLTGANGQRITVPNSATWNFGNGSFTVEWWEKRTSLANDGNYVIARDGTTAYVPFIMGAAYKGSLNNYVSMSSNGTSWDIADSGYMGSIDLNQWNHFVIRRSGNNFYTYKNGTQTNTFSSSAALNTNSNSLSIGYGQNSSYVFVGSLDELRISRSARSPDWISTEYTNQASPATFLAMGSETTIGGAGGFTIANPVVPSNTSAFQLNLTGIGTTWGGGTVFSVTGVAGVSLVSHSVASAISATLTISTGNATGTLTVSDGTYTRNVTVTSGILSRMLRVDHTKVAADLTRFPVLVDLCDATLKTTANGGSVQNASGYDILFWADGAHTVPTGWEIEKYDGAAGCLIAHVKRDLSHTADTLFSMTYGDQNINTFQGASPWDANFKAVWHLPDGTTLTAKDSTGAHNGSLSGGPPPSATASYTNELNGAASFDGSSSWINAGTLGSLPHGGHTVEAWVKPVAGGTRLIVDGEGGGASGGLDFRVQSGAIYYEYFQDGTHYSTRQTSVALPLNTWSHVAATFDGTTIQLYVNGVLASMAAPGNSGTVTADWSGLVPLALGWRNGIPSSFVWSGGIDEVRISSTLRSADWLLTEVNNQTAAAAFVTMESSTASVSSFPSVVPAGTSNVVVTLSGAGTNWGAGTVFSVSGMSGVTITSQSVISSNSATVTLNVGNYTGALTISDGTANSIVTAGSPGLSATFSGPWLYAVQKGIPASGDTWCMMQTVNGIRSTLNDGSGINGEMPGGANIAFFAESPDLTTLTLINKLSGLGTSDYKGLGICSGNSGSMKSQAPISFDGLYILPVFCNAGVNSKYPSFQISSSADDGAHWWRVEDATRITSCSWSAGTATCTTPAQTTPLAPGNLVIIEGVSPSGYNGTFTAAAGTNSTKVVYTVADPGASGSGGVVLGPGSANGTPHTTSLINSSSFRIWLAQYNTDNTPCCGNVDENNTYIQALTFTSAGIINMRIPKATWWDSATYQYWVSGTTYTSNMNSATAISCLVNGAAAPCAGLNFIMSISYVTDPALPDGGQYITIGSVGQDSVWTASHIYGPWTLVASAPMDPGGSPVSYGFANTIPSLYTPISSNPYKARLRIQEGGQYFTNYYYPIHRDVILGLKSANASQLFNRAATPGVTGRGGQFHHTENGLQALWQFESDGDFLTSPVPDVSGNGNNINLSAATADPKYQMFSAVGVENTNPWYNNQWQSHGGAWSVPTGFGQDLGDFTVLFVGRSDLNGAQLAMAGPMNSPGSGFGWRIFGGTMSFSIRGSAVVELTCPAPAANAFFAYIGIRRGGTVYCFKSDKAAPTSAGGDSATLGSYNLSLGSASDQAANYFRGTLGEVAIWNRALCSNQISGSCGRGQVDEVQREFGVVRTESKARGWGIQ